MPRVEIQVEEREGGRVAVFVSQPVKGTPREKRVVASIVSAALSASLPPIPDNYGDSDESELERTLRAARQTVD